MLWRMQHVSTQTRFRSELTAAVPKAAKDAAQVPAVSKGLFMKHAIRAIQM